MLVDLKVSIQRLPEDMRSSVVVSCGCQRNSQCRRCHGYGFREQAVTIYAAEIEPRLYTLLSERSAGGRTGFPIWGQALLNRLAWHTPELRERGLLSNGMHDKLTMLGRAAASMESPLDLIVVECVSQH